MKSFRSHVYYLALINKNKLLGKNPEKNVNKMTGEKYQGFIFRKFLLRFREKF